MKFRLTVQARVINSANELLRLIKCHLISNVLKICY